MLSDEQMNSQTKSRVRVVAVAVVLLLVIGIAQMVNRGTSSANVKQNIALKEDGTAKGGQLAAWKAVSPTDANVIAAAKCGFEDATQQRLGVRWEFRAVFMAEVRNTYPTNYRLVVMGLESPVVAKPPPGVPVLILLGVVFPVAPPSGCMTEVYGVYRERSGSALPTQPIAPSAGVGRGHGPVQLCDIICRRDGFTSGVCVQTLCPPPRPGHCNDNCHFVGVGACDFPQESCCCKK